MKGRIIIGVVASLFSMLFLFAFVLIDYSTAESMQQLKQWANQRGVHEDIFVFYRVLNAVTAIGWAVAAIAAFTGNRELFKLTTMFVLGYFFWDILSYVPMTKIAGEPIAMDQWIFLAISVAFVWAAIVFFPKSKAAVA
ncbi:hypothetical protein EFK68_03435 [Pseudomonas aeruginosa]|nr:hypothetical protein EFK68_03435 [Pseudomonas aeruginosa]